MMVPGGAAAQGFDRVQEHAAIAARCKGMPRQRLAWLCGLYLMGVGLAHADAQLQTGHFATDEAAIALARANGGAIRFSTEARIGAEGDTSLSIRLQPFGDGEGEGEKEGGDDRPPKWPKGVPVPFSLTSDGKGIVALTVTLQGKPVTVRNDRDLKIVSDFTDLFIRSRVKGAGASLSFSDLLLNGLLVGDGAAAAVAGGAGGDKSGLDILRIAGGGLPEGFQLSGHITADWHGSQPDDAVLDAMIWGAKIIGSVPDNPAPRVGLVQPEPGSFVVTAFPTVVATFTAVGSGIDPASVRLLLDGADRTAQAQASATGLSFTPTAALAEGPHQVLVFARNRAGLSSQAAASFTVDTVPPKLAITAPTSPVIQDNPAPAIAVSYSDATSGFDTTSLRVAIDGNLLTTQCQVGVAAAACSPPALAAGNHVLKVWGRDRAGNLTTQSFAFRLVYDTTPPSLAITAPTQPLILGNPSPAIALTYSDAGSGIDTASLRVLVDQVDITARCTAGAAAAQCQPPRLGRGAHAVKAQISDRRGNRAIAGASFTLALPVPIAFTAPKPEQLTPVAAVRVAGTVGTAATSVQVNGVAAALSAGNFSIDALGLHEGINYLVAVAQDADGNVGTAAVRVTVDTTPPRISFSSPADHAVVSSATVTVTGLVNDLTVGTVNQTQATVSVNGVAATVAHRSFVAAGVPLAPGNNQLVAVATDRAGNQARATLHVAQAQPTGAPTIRAVSGDGQSGTILTPLSAPLVVAVADASGSPQANAAVVFRVVQGNGTLPAGGRSVLVRTDAQGRAAAAWTLGSRAGAAVNRVRATAAGVQGDVIFSAQAAPGPPVAVYVASGDDQNGAVGSDLAQAFFAVVLDQGDNPVAGVPVTWKVVQGGGGFGGAASVTVPSDDSGLATARLTLGPQAGLDNNRVEASFPALAARPATFKASGFLLGDPAQTRVAGIVLDNQGLPVPGVTIRLRDSTLTTLTDPAGQFRLAGVPVGQLFLIADATTATRAGSWASLEYEIFALAGIENHLPKPIYILPLALAQGVFVDETHGGSVKIPAVPGFALDVAPGSVTFPGGGRNGTVSVTAVHIDKIPMPPGAGMQPRLIVTIQPAGARFEPPARLSLPNVDGRAPGSVTELFSFDHALGAFVSVGTGTVSEDGEVLQSDPGFGVVEAGWHCGSPASSNGDAQQVNVTITDTKPVFLCGDNPGAAKTLHASGGPPQDASYSWQSGNAGVVALAPSGQGLCQGAAECDTLATAGATGRTNATVTINCSTSGATASDSTDVVVAKVTSLQVANATASAADPRCYVTNTHQPADDVKITAVLDPGVGPGEVPPDFLVWTGGTAGANAVERLVTRGGASSTQLQATCGGPAQPQQQVQLFVVAADTPPANQPAQLVHTLGGASNPGGDFGLTVVTIGQQGVVGPQFDVNAYLDGNTWRFRVPQIRHTYKVGIHGLGRTDIAGAGDPGVTKGTLCQIIPDLTPPGAGVGHGPPRTHYWSSAITQAHEDCHVSRFYTDPAFWPQFMTQFQQQVENDSVTFDCQDPAKQNSADVIAGKRQTWQQAANNFHGQADQAEIGGSEVACHNVSNPLYTNLINAIRNTVPPLDPAALAGAAAHGHISLAWSSTACNETGFRVERKTNAPNAPFGTIGNAPACAAQPCAPAFVDGNVTAGTTYIYRVIATGQAGDSNPTPTVAVKAVP
jgi:hypothetical protein